MGNVEISAPVTSAASRILAPAAKEFLAKLHGNFDVQRRELLDRRRARQSDLDAGRFPDFLPETRSIRASDWKIAPVPADLQDRRVEITGPVERKMIINALNSGAKVFMADFEDSNSPTWANCILGQVNLHDAVRQTISFASPEGKAYRLNDKTATLMVRPRGWHLVEKHARVDGAPMSGSLFDFGLFFFHNARELIDRGTGPYFYLPKMESHLEARLWNDVFNFAQDYLKIPRGTIKATVLIETILASFEMNEILYELRDHSAGLNCGRWDYIFSVIKEFSKHERFVLPDRSAVTMTAPFMRAYSQLVIKTCHKRGAHAMGGMAAQIPIKNDPAANDAAISKVRADKEREAGDGHDGTWVAHPGLVQIAMEVFDRKMPGANQLHVMRDDVNVSASDLLNTPSGPITEDGLRANINIGVRYLEAWLAGNGCVPIFNLMEDAATAEISRSQVWQWIHHARGTLSNGGSNGSKVTVDLVRKIMKEEQQKIRAGGDSATLDRAAQLFDRLATADEFTEFLTLPAYDLLE